MDGCGSRHRSSPLNICPVTTTGTWVVYSDVPALRGLGAVGLLIPSAYGYGYCSPVATDPYGCGNGTPSNSFGKGTNNGATPIWDSFLRVLPDEAYRSHALWRHSAIG